MLKHKEIAIIGGGPGGLTLARLLQLKGLNVNVYERDLDREARIQGGALDLHTDSGLAALEKAGLMDEFKANFRPGADLTRVVDHKAKIYFDQHLEENHLQFEDKNYRPEIDRGPLRNILLDSLATNTVHWNCHILSIEPLADQWKIIFENGHAVIADIVIGADGANSKIRPFVTPIKPFWTGITMVEGSVKNADKTAPNIHRLLKGGKIFAYGNDKTLIVSAKGDGSLGFSTSHKTSEFWYRESGIDFKDNKQVLAWFKQAYAEWDQIWHELFQSEDTLFIPRPQYCMPLDQKWKAKANITLIGDAAHWMPPFAGEGVNMAMLDALQLSEALTDPSFTDTQKAIQTYERKMFSRFESVGQMTLFNTQWMHQPNALNKMLAMFSKNKLKQGLFFFNYMIKVMLIPFTRKVFGLAPKQKVFAST
ncbi:NAD(P)/FAD-dependent oxidoreductase [Pedobacter sp. ASV28]|uniref:FAD-dependent oxidoreductase n=1 Tax=Pedobacter sp. ASV28 TaxID=2795123 RepID=UPI0018EADA5F|nr:NAD(P)/FAD-dependent oxidoreductase [Pedobacter sp. ASV28]